MGVEYAYFRGVYDILSSFVAGWEKLNGVCCCGGKWGLEVSWRVGDLERLYEIRACMDGGRNDECDDYQP